MVGTSPLSLHPKFQAPLRRRRWEVSSSSLSDPATNLPPPPLQTLYDMPDIGFRNSDDFTGIADRNPPSPQLMDSIYKNTHFEMRFYEQIQVVESPTASSDSAKFLVSAAMHPASDPASLADFDKWYREEHLPLLSRLPGFVRSRRFEIASATVLNQAQFGDVLEKAPRYLALHEFSGKELPWEELAKSGETVWAKGVLGSVERVEMGYYAAGRVYPESEWGNVGK